MMWSYMMAVVTDPGRVPPGWHPFSDEAAARAELERLAATEDSHYDRRDPRRPRYCKRCQAWKPERAHHCSATGRCVLKMDHYCIWVVNCVGLLNYKPFLLFLAYSTAAAGLASGLLVKPTIDFFTGVDFGHPTAFIGSVMAIAFTMAMAGFLIMHAQLLSANCSTIEMYEKARIQPWPYNRGLRRNLEEVFGKDRWRWALPISSREDRRAMLDAVLAPRLLTPGGFLSSPV